MSSTTDDAKGRIKEAAGSLTGDAGLKREGRADQLGAKVKDAAEHAKDKVADGVEAVKEHFSKTDKKR